MNFGETEGKTRSSLLLYLRCATTPETREKWRSNVKYLARLAKEKIRGNPLVEIVVVLTTLVITVVKRKLGIVNREEGEEEEEVEEEERMAQMNTTTGEMRLVSKDSIHEGGEQGLYL